MAISALVMPFTSPDGVVHPASVWLPGTVVMDNLDQAGSVTWVCWHDAETFAAKDAPVAGGQHLTQIAAVLYGAVNLFPVVAGTYGQATEAALTYLAVNVKDTPALPGADGAPLLNADGTPQLVSFFAGAQVVTLGT